MYKNIGTRVSELVIKDIEYLAKEENLDKSKVVRSLLTEAVKKKLIELSLKKYSNREISIGRAAELAKIPLVDFIRIATNRKIPINYTIGSLKKDFKAIAK